MFGYGVVVATFMSIYHAGGSTLAGARRGNAVETFDEKEGHRLHRRAPISEFVERNGEGRGTTTYAVFL